MARTAKTAAPEQADAAPSPENPHAHFHNVEALLASLEAQWVDMAKNVHTPAEAVIETLSAIHILRKEVEEERP